MTDPINIDLMHNSLGVFQTACFAQLSDDIESDLNAEEEALSSAQAQQEALVLSLSIACVDGVVERNVLEQIVDCFGLEAGRLEGVEAEAALQELADLAADYETWKFSPSPLLVRLAVLDADEGTSRVPMYEATATGAAKSIMGVGDISPAQTAQLNRFCTMLALVRRAAESYPSADIQDIGDEVVTDGMADELHRELGHLPCVNPEVDHFATTMLQLWIQGVPE